MKKRILTGLLTVCMLLQSVYLPVQAAPVDPLGGGLPTAVTSSIEEATQTGGDSEGQTGEKQEQTPSETKENAEGDSNEQPGAEENGEDRESNAPDTEEKEDGQEGDTSDTGENEEAQDGDEESSDEDGKASVSENAAEDVLTDDGKEPEAALLSLEEPESEMITAEVSDGIFQEGSFNVLGDRTGVPAGQYSLTAQQQAQNWDEAIAYCYEQMLRRTAEIDLTEYGILSDDCSKFFSAVINSHPDLYFVGNSFSFSHSDSIITKFKPTYLTGYDDAAFQAAVNEAMACVQPGMSDLEKAIVLHDYLTVNCEYDYQNYLDHNVPKDSYSAYGVMVNKTAVCQGYALAYLLLLNRAGIECYMVSSSAMNHAWNLISLDGQYYQVDVTWDDPTWDKLGRSCHQYMFRSDSKLEGHHDWEVTSGSGVVNYTATDTRYDDAFWYSCTTPLILNDNDCYYIEYDTDKLIGVIKKGTLSNLSDTGETIKNIGRWNVWGISNSFWQSAFSGLFLFNDRLYYNTSTAICSINFDGTGERTEYTPDTSTGYICGSALRQGKVVYTLHQDPDEEGKETVLTADGLDLSEEPDYSDQKMNADNLSAQYTALDGSQLSSKAQGKPKLLIFYSNTCGNSQMTIQDISLMIDSFGGADVYAIETNHNTKESVEQFRQIYGCDEILFSYDTGTNNYSSMCEYTRLAGYTGIITWPVICYIDADNKLQYVTSGIQSVGEVLQNLREYCGYTYMPPQVYRITYVLKGGTNDAGNPSSYTSVSDTIVLKDPVREGYDFDGWYLDQQYTSRISQIKTGSSGDLTLYAKWISRHPSDIPVVDISPAEGNAVMGFSGSFYTETAEKILERLNEIRLEACKEGVPNPNGNGTLTMDDYVPLQWSADLEAIARQRAAEATVSQSHTRPNGESCFTAMTENGAQSWGENLAWNYSGLMAGIEQWYDEKADWVKQNSSAVTGHYTNIINPNFKGVGLGAFRLSTGGWYAVAQEFQYEEVSNERKNTEQGACVWPIEVEKDHIDRLYVKLPCPNYVKVGDSYTFSAQLDVHYNDYNGNNKTYTGPCVGGVTWSSDDPDVVEIDQTGKITGKKLGETSIYVRIKSLRYSTTIRVVEELPITLQRPAKTTYTVGQDIDLSGGKVTYEKNGNKTTVNLSASMISGFDSSKAGICTVSVLYQDYPASFPVLIVEEPKMEALAGQRLQELEFPSDENGAYAWISDPETVVDRVGVSTYQAKYTPKNKDDFTDIDVTVTVTVRCDLGKTCSVQLKEDGFVYDGTYQKPKAAVTGYGTVLEEGKDYELSYLNNKDAGTAELTVTGIGSYYGTKTVQFTIEPAPLIIKAKDQVVRIGGKAPVDNFAYEIIGLMPHDVLLKAPVTGCDCSGPIDTSKAGRYVITVGGADAGSNYTITYVNGTLTVAEEDVFCNVTYDVQGHGTAPEDTVGIKVGGMIERPDDPHADGYRFDGWYKDAACTRAWDFAADIVQEDTVLYAKWIRQSKKGSFALQEIADLYYTGKACKPAVSVYDGDMPLKLNKDYTVKYFNNKNANKDGAVRKGTGTGSDFNPDLPYVQITGKGNYDEVVKVNFNILPVSIGSGSRPADQTVLKVNDQLAVSGKTQKVFSSIKCAGSMKQDRDYTLTLTPVNARDQSGEEVLGKNMEQAVIPAGYEGTFRLTVNGIGNYAGSIDTVIRVADKNHLIKNASVTLGKNQKNITLDPDSADGAGAAVTLTPSMEASADTFVVKCGKTVLEPDTDYTVSYRNNDRVGKAELIITGRGGYVGSRTVTFNIKGAPFNAKTVDVKTSDAAAQGTKEPDADAFQSSMTYTGRALTQNKVKLTARASGSDSQPRALQYGIHYTVSYKNNIKKGTATMTFTAKPESGYTGSFKKTFKITAADIGTGGVKAEAVKAAGNEADQILSASGAVGYELKGTVFYSKAGAKPSGRIRLTDRSGNVLKEGTDYTVTYQNNKAVTTAQTAESSKPCMTVKGKGNYTGSFPVFFEISPAPLAENADIAAAASAMAYDAKKADDYLYQPKVTVKDAGKALNAGKDYEIEYRNNSQSQVDAYLQKYGGKGEKESDTPQIIVTACEGGCYTGQLSIPLPVYRNKLTASNLQVTVRQDSDKGIVYTGSRVTPEVEVRYMDGTTSRLLEEGADYSLSYGANVQSGRNKGSVTVTGLAPQYGGSVTVKFTIVRKAIAY